VLKAAPGSVDEVPAGASDADDTASLAIFTACPPCFPWVSDDHHPYKKNQNYDFAENDMTYRALLFQLLRDSESCVCKERSCAKHGNQLHIE
jgi:hypothetical protein